MAQPKTSNTVEFLLLVGMSHIWIPCMSNYHILQNLASKAYVKEIFDADVVMFFKFCITNLFQCVRRVKTYFLWLL